MQNLQVIIYIYVLSLPVLVSVIKNLHRRQFFWVVSIHDKLIDLFFAFGIIRSRFPMPIFCFISMREDSAIFSCVPALFLLNICIDISDGREYYTKGEEEDVE